LSSIRTLPLTIKVYESYRRTKAASDPETHSDAQKFPGHKDSKTTAIYRRDKEEAVLPSSENKLFSL